MIIPPPIPINPLKIPALNPIRTRISIVDGDIQLNYEYKSKDYFGIIPPLDYTLASQSYQTFP